MSAFFSKIWRTCWGSLRRDEIELLASRPCRRRCCHRGRCPRRVDDRFGALVPQSQKARLAAGRLGLWASVDSDIRACCAFGRDSLEERAGRGEPRVGHRSVRTKWISERFVECALLSAASPGLGAGGGQLSVALGTFASRCIFSLFYNSQRTVGAIPCVDIFCLRIEFRGL